MNGARYLPALELVARLTYSIVLYYVYLPLLEQIECVARPPLEPVLQTVGGRTVGGQKVLE